MHRTPITHSVQNFDLKISSLERALFELNYCIPELITFEEAAYLYEGMLNLNQKLVQRLLENCNYIKVKRLFLYFAELKKLPCMDNISLENVYLGSGKRVIVKNGKYDKKYKKQTVLMLDCLSICLREEIWALKGGTAINFFYKNLPRLSVDIDLTYLPIKGRNDSLKEMSNSLTRIKYSLKGFDPYSDHLSAVFF